MLVVRYSAKTLNSYGLWPLPYPKMFSFNSLSQEIQYVLQLSWNCCEIIILLALFTCVLPDRQQFSPLGNTWLPVISESSFSPTGWTCTSACKTKSSLPLCSDCSHVSFWPLVTLELQVIFCRAILVLMGHYVLLIWERWTSVSVAVAVYWGFVWNGKKKSQYCLIIKDKIWKQTFKGQILHFT